jgi:hypothetical protein
MVNWAEKRAEFQKRIDEMPPGDMINNINELNRLTQQYIAKGGTSQDPNNSEYTQIQEVAARIVAYKDKVGALNTEIMNYAKEVANNSDIGGVLSEIGTLQSNINSLEKLKSELTVDVDSALARDELLRSRESDVSRHQLLLLGRPIRKALIPYIWGLSILFIGIGVIIFKMSFPALPEMGTSSSGLLLSIFSDKKLWMALFGAALIVILFLSLKIAGVFGK